MTESPGTKKVAKLLEKVHDGSYVIPYFQRRFEWQPSMVCDLFESILQDYHAGLLLLWELNPEEVRHEKWDAVWGADEGAPKEAILDGQQRLASLYYAIYNPEKKFPNRKSYYMFFIDLNEVLNENYEKAVTYKYYANYQSWAQIRENKDEWTETGKIPLSILSAKDPNSNNKYINSVEFFNWSVEFIQKSNLTNNVTPFKINGIFLGILNYNFVYYTLSQERDLHDICNIFARVNSKGMRLSIFDLMNAFLYPHGIELRKDLWENLDNELLKDIDTNMNEYLLKLISLVKQEYCSSKYLYNLIPKRKTVRRDEHRKKYEDILVEDREDFEGLWYESCEYAEKARKIIMNSGKAEFGAIKTDFIPNTTIVPVLGAILWEYNGSSDDIDFRKKLKKWYWSAVLSEDYSGSSDSVMAKDFRDWRKWINSGKSIERINRINQEFINELDLKNTKKGSARYNAILCILALNNVKDFYTGEIVGIGDFSREKINDHHIFPKGVKGLDSEKSKIFSELKDSLVNRTLLLDETNNKIKNKKPSQYIAEMIKRYDDDEQKVKLILQKHLINEKAFEYMKVDDFDSFVIEREKAVREHIISNLI